MNKKTYQTPATMVVSVNVESMLLGGSNRVSSITGNLGESNLKNGGSDANYSGGARVKGGESYDVWDDDWSK